MSATALLFAFGAGLASFVSPCVLPLVPVYLAQLVGPGILFGQAQARAGTTKTSSAIASGMAASAPVGNAQTLSGHAAPLRQTAAFVAGFGLAFIALGATASELGALLTAHQQALRRVGGVALMLFGLHVAGLVRIPWLERERRLTLRMGKPGYATALAMGVVFGIGWTPCVGPYLASILVLAANAHTLRAGVGLLAVYALGLGLPFLLVAAAFDRLAPVLKRLSPYLPVIERVAGLLLVALGVIIFFNWLLFVNSWIKIGV